MTKKDYILDHLRMIAEEREMIHKLPMSQDNEQKLEKNYERAMKWAKRLLNPDEWSGY